MRWALVIALAGFVIWAQSLLAAPQQQFSFTLDQASPVSGPVTFTAASTIPVSSHDPVMWVTLACVDAGGVPVILLDDDRVVAWFTPTEGHTSPIGVGGVSCRATLTATPWHVHHNDPFIEFAVN